MMFLKMKFLKWNFENKISENEFRKEIWKIKFLKTIFWKEYTKMEFRNEISENEI